jgi:hypothetical protein
VFCLERRREEVREEEEYSDPLFGDFFTTEVSIETLPDIASDPVIDKLKI